LFRADDDGSLPGSGLWSSAPPQGSVTLWTRINQSIFAVVGYRLLELIDRDL
jgi:hypothetical protein